jgi:hypothetical protein
VYSTDYSTELLALGPQCVACAQSSHAMCAHVGMKRKKGRGKEKEGGCLLFEDLQSLLEPVLFVQVECPVFFFMRDTWVIFFSNIYFG